MTKQDSPYRQEQLRFENESVAVVSHDAGGAEILSSYVRRHALQPIYVLDGPARDIFTRKLGPVKTSSLSDALKQATVLLCSTGWQTNLEFDAIKESETLGMPSVAFLDHWVNYSERFVRAGQTALPSQIWVGDTAAQKIAKGAFPEHPIFFEENPYFLDIKEQIATFGSSVKADEGLAILYVCEPIKEHAKLRYGNERHWGYVEEDAMRYFLSHLPLLGHKIREIRIRPHPAEDRDKYSWASKEFEMPIVQGGNNSLLAEIAASDVVVGCESMAMVIGLLAGKQVISCIPPGGKKCMLPQNEILMLQNFILEQRDR